jgi:type I site-specific restriction-modification system R (restriction) subunit
MRQWNNIDITAIVNGEFLVIIEAKTSSKKHSGQLDRYKEFATNHCTEKQVARALFTSKTGNENLKFKLPVECVFNKQIFSRTYEFG